MNHPAARLVLALAVILLIGGLALLYRLRLARGDVFPAYSTLRADPLGARAWHDALARLPGFSVERRLQLLRKMEAAPARTIVLAGVAREQWAQFTFEEFNALDAAVRAGSRLVIAMRGEVLTPAATDQPADASERTNEARAKSRLRRRPVEHVDLQARWGIAIKDRQSGPASGHAMRTEDAGTDLPEVLTWRSNLQFEPQPGIGWRVIYRRDGQPVLLELPLGRGSIVLASGSYFLSNEALQRDRATPLLAWIVGAHHRVVFEESHLGIVAEPGIAALARRYGLGAAFSTLLLLAGLFVWQRMAAFVPPGAVESTDLALTYHPAAGLEALLRRSVPVAALGSACLEEWRRTASPQDRKRVEAALAALPAKAAAVTLHNVARGALRRR